MAQAPPLRVRMGVLVALTVMTASACSLQDKPATVLPPQSTASAVPTADPDPDVSATGLPDGVDIDAPASVSTTWDGSDLDYVSPIYTLTPTGALPRPASVRLKLDNALPSSTTVLVVTRTSSTQPWTWQAGRLSTDLRHVEYAASSLDQVAVLSMDVATAKAQALRDFTPSIGSSAPLKLSSPTCAGQPAALEDGYSVVEPGNLPTLLTCFGLEDGKRVLRLTNRRPVPVQVSHPGVAVLKAPPVGAAWAPWNKMLGTVNTILDPGRTVAYTTDLEPGTNVSVAAAYGSGVVSLRVLQAGVRTIALSLKSLGLGPVYVTKTMTALLARPACAKTIGKGSDAILAGCLSPAVLTRTLGSQARLVAPLVSSPAFRTLARKETARLKDQAPDQVERITVRRAAPDFSKLLGLWSGATRLLSVDSDGVVTEKVQSGCCDLVIKLTYQLEEPVTKAGVTRAKATITGVKVGRRKLLAGKVPKVGATGTLTLRAGVITPPYLATNYCAPKPAKKGTCGT